MESRFLWKRLSWPLQVVVWIFAFYIAWNLIPQGFEKLTGEFNTYLIVIAVVEILGSILLFIPKISFYGAAPIVIITGVSGYYNTGDTTTITLAFLALIIAILARPGILRKKPKITRISI